MTICRQDKLRVFYVLIFINGAMIGEYIEVRSNMRFFANKYTIAFFINYSQPAQYHPIYNFFPLLFLFEIAI